MSLKEILKNAQGVPTGEYKDIAGGTMYADSPIGSILPYGGTTAPSGWMICNGASLLRTDYAELFAVIGTAFGSADSTHFNIPDLRGEFLRGAGTNSHSGQGNGGSVGQHQDGTPIVASYMGNSGGSIYNMAGGYSSNMSAKSDKWTGNSSTTYLHHPSATEAATYSDIIGKGITRPTNTSVNYIIKAKMVALPADFMDALNDKQDATDNNLQTTDKTIVGAINEVDAEVGALQTSVSNKLQLYSYEITDKLTDANGNMPCGYISSLGIPINFKPYNVNNYPCNAFIDQAGMIFVRPLNNTWGISDYGSVANFNLKGTLYCVK